MSKLTLDDIIGIAAGAYGDHIVECSYDPDTCSAIEGAGDTLALLIVRELIDTYPPCASDEDKLVAARDVMDSAQGQLGNVVEAFAARVREYDG